MAPVKEKLLETLGELSFGEIQQFKWLLQQLQMEDFPKIPRVRMEMADSAVDIVELMVEICGQQSVEVTRDVLKVMNRMDLVWSLSDTSSANQGPARSLEFGAYGGITDETKKPVKVKLLETLEELSFNEIEQFKWLLQHLQRKDLSKIPRDRIEMVDRVDLVELMVEFCGQQSVEVTREVLKEMNRMDLVWSLSDISSPSKGPARSLELGAYGGIMDETITPVKDKLLEILGELSFEEIEHLKWLLKHLQVEDCPIIPRYQLEMADMVDLVDLIVEICGQQSVEVTREILKEMNRMDLVWSLSDTSSAFKGPSRSLESEAGGAIMESNDWMKFEPEVNSTDADEDPTHSLLCDAGKFECSVSGLRWVCDKRVSFKYQFCSWEEHMERMESLQYMPAGPLMDITVTAGKLKEVYLPHWICTDDNPEILDEFAVLHIDSSGDVVEDASEVTSSHVKLSEPIFSPRAVLMKAGFPVKINCNVLIYKTNTAFLTLHVYLIPRDPGLGQIMDKRELSYGYEVIRKPHPERSLKLQDRFILTTDLDKAEIYPKTLKLRYENRNPNFFEVFVENPDRNFQLKLALENELEPVWICAIRKDEYQSTGQQQQQEGKDFVDKHWCSLIGRVNNLGPIMDNLRTEGVVHQEKYDQIMALPTTQERMRTLFSGPLKASGDKGKDIFYRLLQKHEPYLVKDLKGNEF
ncbi:apoptosis-associated speck-like protein containing a CARD [Scomber japonicus]|uniref:apoptosis-associated speck-like protein containing a CARD n=1 Tax=Scomber japonicus TaxID=13676 RepID=UPI0023066E5F|nr:apoptosis-associated speck-like protein containing a CARD [Scomber japonicus]